MFAVVAEKCVPLIVIGVFVRAIAGEKLLIVGSPLSLRTVKAVPDVADPDGAVTLIVPGPEPPEPTTIAPLAERSAPCRTNSSSARRRKLPR